MFKKRGYTRENEQYKKDYRLFAIACEGSKREPEYFQLFHYLSDRIKVDIIKESEALIGFTNKSSPNWVLDRAVNYVENMGLGDEDEIWLVIDVDNWKQNQIKDLYEESSKKNNWNLAISNPCFEIWLYFHYKSNIDEINYTSSKELKNILSNLLPNGYDRFDAVKNVKTAIKNSENLDEAKDYFFPNKNRTKVYQLMKSILNYSGENNFNEFVNKKIDFLKELSSQNRT